MKYSEYKLKAFPEHKRESDSNYTFVSRIYRPMGLVLGYIFYKIGLGANVVSMLRVFIMLGCFYLLTMSGKGYLNIRVFAVAMLLFIKILDYADGAIARVRNTSNELGERLDSFSDRPVRAGMILVLFGYYTGNVFMIPYAVFLEWVIHQFGKPIKVKNNGLNDNAGGQNKKKKLFSLLLDTSSDVDEAQPDSILLLMLNLYSKLFKSDIMHFVFLPLIIAVLNNPENMDVLSEISFIIIGFYTSVMLLRYIGGVREYSGRQLKS